MPRPKKTNDKPAKPASRKKRVSPPSQKEAGKKKPNKARPIFVDVISDELEAGDLPLSRSLEEKKAAVKSEDSSLEDDAERLQVKEEGYFPADREEGGRFFDKQRHYYSDLVRQMEREPGNEETEDSRERPVPRSRKRVPAYRRFAFRFFLLVIALLLVVGYFSFSSLVIDIVPNREIISDSMVIEISTGAENTSSSSVTELLGGQVESRDIEVERSYPSSGEEVLGEEVVGKVTLVNNYSKAQPLVATTRLLTPDNKLFRLKDGVTIPAGSSVEVEVYADSPSSSLAIGPSTFTIPGLWVGLQDEIYGQSSTAFEYRHKVENYIKQGDLDYAYSNIRSLIEEEARSLGLGQDTVLSIDSNNTIIESAAKAGDKVANFSVKAKNRVAIISFDKNVVEKMVEAKLDYVVPDDKEMKGFDPKDISYAIESYDTETQTARIKVSFQATVTLKNDAEVLDRAKLVNLSEQQLGEYLKSVPAISSFTLNFRPDFIKKSPSLADRIKIRIQE